MPHLFRLPKDEAEYEKWKGVVSTAKGVNVSDWGVSTKLKFSLKRHFYVAENQLMCVKTGRRILKQSEIPEVFCTYHDNCGHPGRDLTVSKIRSVYASISKNSVKKYIEDCTICKQKKNLPRAPAEKPIKFLGTRGDPKVVSLRYFPKS